MASQDEDSLAYELTRATNMALVNSMELLNINCSIMQIRNDMDSYISKGGTPEGTLYKCFKEIETVLLEERKRIQARCDQPSPIRAIIERKRIVAKQMFKPE